MSGAEAADNSAHVAELKRRVDALFKCAEGRVGPGDAELACFCERLNEVVASLLRQVRERARVIKPASEPAKRARRESVVCCGSWEARRESVEQLEAECGTLAPYEQLWVPLDSKAAGPVRSWSAADTADEGGAVLRVRQFREYYFSSGCRVWDSSVALARWLHARPAETRDRDVLELGAGVGLPGLCCAQLGARRVRLTDCEANLLPNLRYNAALAFAATRAPPSEPTAATRAAALMPPPAPPPAAEPPAAATALVEVEPLDWSAPPSDLTASHGRYDVIIGSDIVYSSGCVPSLIGALGALLRCRRSHAADSCWLRTWPHMSRASD